MSIPKTYTERYNGSYCSDQRKMFRENLDTYLTNVGLKISGQDFRLVSPEGDECTVTSVYHFRDATVSLKSREFPSNHRSKPHLIDQLEMSVIASDLSVAEGLGIHLKSIALSER
jgi:hypothetical protein